MRGTPYRLDVRPLLPPPLQRLDELSNDLWYSWNRATRALFARLHPALWAAAGHSPKAFLRTIDQTHLERAASDPAFLSAFHRVLSAYDTYHGEPPRGVTQLEAGDVVAYFCAEFGLHESLPIYSGGLGILAGDHCKTASDMGLPFVGVGLLYRHGYFQQTIDAEGRQHAAYADTDFDLLPIVPVLRADGRELRIALGMPGGALQIKVWRARIGHVQLYLLDTDIEENSERDRYITHQLYVGNQGTRLEQEIVLGVGGMRALAELGVAPVCWHLNEGHPAFVVLERIRALMAGGLGFDAALEAVAANTVFTTHTPVPAGHDHFPEDLVRQYLASACPELAGHLDAALAIGHADSTQDFNLTALAVRGSRHQNGVSRIHEQVSSRVCAELWPQIEPDENPVRHITNGVHVSTFLADAWHDLFDEHIGVGWTQRLTDAEHWLRVRHIPDPQFWSVHQSLKSQMLHLVRYRIREQHARNQGSEAHLDRILKLADPENPNILTIGFARRFATYKRATLLFRNLAWLREIMGDPRRQVVFIFAGKAHPADQPGQDLIRRIAEVARMPEFESRILLVEGYDLRLARRLVTGVDVWMNNPVYPMEASGTSGIKAGVNGVINLSVLDGWWGEGYNGKNGWAIKPASSALDAPRRDEEEARTLYELLQDQVIPLYYAVGPAGYSPGWVAMAKESIASLTPRFSSVRMLSEYAGHCYAPAIRQWRELSRNGFEAARTIAAWKAKVRQGWAGVSLRRVDQPVTRIDHGGAVRIAVAAKLNGLAPEDLAVEVLLARPGTELASQSLERGQLACERALPESGEHLYSLDLAPEQCGRIEYRIRAYPCHDQLTHPFEMGMMIWL
ncbi:MAG: alpha-glucan family phosphorylase [Betaproteobacteria bacterium]|nr:alpha-glucan family phosphorylase [Betaproteobacteria bacterium]